MSTIEQVSSFQLLQWKHAIRLEKLGIKVARRSVNAHAGRFLGLGSRCNRDTVLSTIQDELDWRTKTESLIHSAADESQRNTELNHKGEEV